MERRSRTRVALFSLLFQLLASGASLAQPIPPEVSASAHQWPLPNKDYASTRADFDSCIDSSNIVDLTVAWTFPFPAFAFPGLAFFGHVATNPLVLGGIVYFQARPI